ncbi:MAG: homogentisate 1,2-dioxygenase [bacterium]|nr:homogentisate 1,2-dioxygenase [bacterium]
MNDSRNVHLVKGIVATTAHKHLPPNTYEEEYGRAGFFSRIAHLTHLNPPTNWKRIEGDLRPRSFDTNQLNWEENVYFPLLWNEDVTMAMLQQTNEMKFYFRNADGELIYFVHQGKGICETIFGPIPFRVGDYLLIPKGTLHRLVPEEPTKLLVIEAYKGEIEQPTRGILGQHALYDPASVFIPDPVSYPTEQNKEYEVRILRNGEWTSFFYDTHPLDVIGWKGDLFPWKLNIDQFLPINSHRQHLPPPVHTTFVGKGFVICSFLPRPLETDEDAVKVPFYHSNVDYDEVIFYHDGDFFSRDGISKGMITFHPAGFPHGPHPKARIASQKKTWTDEAAVMLDTTRPLKIHPNLFAIENKEYWKSWGASE